MLTNAPMFWVGGTPGSGKSTIVRQLAYELDLPLHPVDAYAYNHLERMCPSGPSLDDVLAQGAVAAADDFDRTSAERLPLIVDDVLDAQVVGVPTLVEGPQLHPRAAQTLSPLGSLWLITTAERTRSARMNRLVPGDAAGRLRVEALVERDLLLSTRLRAAASELGSAVVHVPTDVVWFDIVSAVRSAIEQSTATYPRLQPGPELASRRRHENDVVHRQIVAHERHIGATLPAFPYACTCGRSGCSDTRPATSADYPALH
jgi:hypothetical protein